MSSHSRARVKDSFRLHSSICALLRLPVSQKNASDRGQNSNGLSLLQVYIHRSPDSPPSSPSAALDRAKHALPQPHVHVSWSSPSGCSSGPHWVTPSPWFPLPTSWSVSPFHGHVLTFRSLTSLSYLTISSLYPLQISWIFICHALTIMCDHPFSGVFYGSTNRPRREYSSSWPRQHYTRSPVSSIIDDIGWLGFCPVSSSEQSLIFNFTLICCTEYRVGLHTK